MDSAPAASGGTKTTPEPGQQPGLNPDHPAVQVSDLVRRLEAQNAALAAENSALRTARDRWRRWFDEAAGALNDQERAQLEIRLSAVGS